jgi:hypothetical protein
MDGVSYGIRRLILTCDGACRENTADTFRIAVSGIHAAIKLFCAEIPRAIVARADGPQVVEGEDAGGMAVGEINLDGIVANSLRRPRAGLGLIHRQHTRSDWTRRARTFFPQIHKVVVARMSIAPCNIHTFAGGNVNFYAGGLFARVDWRWHFIFRVQIESGSG